MKSKRAVKSTFLIGPIVVAMVTDDLRTRWDGAMSLTFLVTSCVIDPRLEKCKSVMAVSNLGLST